MAGQALFANSRAMQTLRMGIYAAGVPLQDFKEPGGDDMELTNDEITALEKLAEISDQLWFQIKTPNYVWDDDNKVRLSVDKACKEFLECTEDHIKSLTAKQKRSIENVKAKVAACIAGNNSN